MEPKKYSTLRASRQQHVRGGFTFFGGNRVAEVSAEKAESSFLSQITAQCMHEDGYSDAEIGRAVGMKRQRVRTVIESGYTYTPVHPFRCKGCGGVQKLYPCLVCQSRELPSNCKSNAWGMGDAG